MQETDTQEATPLHREIAYKLRLTRVGKWEGLNDDANGDGGEDQQG